MTQTPQNDPSGVATWTLRTRKEDSAFLYTVLEATEGIASFTTLPHAPGEADRTVELLIPVSRLPEAEQLVCSLGAVIVEARKDL
ncbi:MAG: hypothetical protein IT285_08510 [Bdellovibrionales bacterium]|nr:hypothetical protein [Bdellovibrionales bacterium]